MGAITMEISARMRLMVSENTAGLIVGPMKASGQGIKCKEEARSHIITGLITKESSTKINVTVMEYTSGQTVVNILETGRKENNMEEVLCIVLKDKNGKANGVKERRFFK
jgi:hypothetical protein